MPSSTLSANRMLELVVYVTNLGNDSLVEAVPVPGWQHIGVIESQCLYSDRAVHVRVRIVTQSSLDTMNVTILRYR